MASQPQEQEREEEPKAEDNRQAKPSKARFEIVFATVAAVCTFAIAWAVVYGHYSTLIIATVVGIMSALAAGCLHWPPKQITRRTTDLLNRVATLLLHDPQSPARDLSPAVIDEPSRADIIQAEYDRLSKDHVRAKLEIERLRNEREKERYKTSELQLADPVDETIESERKNSKSAKGQLPDNQPAYPPHFFHTGYGDQWTEYTEEVFPDVSQDILWQWGYNAAIDNTPRNITPCCLECIPPIPFQYVVTPPNERANFFLVRFECPVHRQSYFETLDKTPFSMPFGVIRQLIQQGFRTTPGLT